MVESFGESNPWLVQSFQEFIRYCCPKCECQKQSIPEFVTHVTNEHDEGADHIRLLYEKEIVPTIDMKIEDLGGATNSEKYVVKQETFDIPGLDFEDPLSMPTNVSMSLKENDDQMDQSESEENIDHWEESKSSQQSIDDDYNDDLIDHLENKEAINQPRKVVKIPILAKKSLSRNSVDHLESDESDDDSEEDPDDPDYEMESTETKRVKSKTNVHSDNATKPRVNCQVCKNSFVSKKTLRRHLKDAHQIINEGEPIPCEVCNELFPKLKLREHQCIEHFEVLNLHFPCEFCYLRFNENYKLTKHLQSHNNKNFKCETCQQTFVSQYNLDNHEQVQHGKEGPKCDLCGKKFTTLSMLNKHKIDIAKNGSCQTPEKTKSVIYCSICDKVFTLKSSLRKHLKNVHGDQEFSISIQEKTYLPEVPKKIEQKPSNVVEKCHFCSANFSTFQELKAHRIEEHTDIVKGDFFCSKCSYTCDEHNKLTKHEKIHLPKNHQCGTCGQKFFNEYNLKNHEQIKHGESGPICDYCGVKFPSIFMYNKHKIQRIKTGVCPEENIIHECKHCGKIFPQKHKLDQHVRIKHDQIKPFKCDQCEMAFGYKRGLKSHVEHIHLKLREHVCEECGKDFTTKQNLVDHLQVIHRGIPLEKKHQCKQCEKRFQTPGQLNEHVKGKHENLMQYFCEYCPKQFKRKKDFKNHVNSAHLGLKVPCEICGKEYMTKAQMKVHVKSVHEKRFIFPCSICQRSFNRIHILQNHIDKIHQVKITHTELRQQLKDNPDVPEIF